jgi:hypothetical protein
MGFAASPSWLHNLIGTDLTAWADPVWWPVLAKLYAALQITANQHSTDTK